MGELSHIKGASPRVLVFFAALALCLGGCAFPSFERCKSGIDSGRERGAYVEGVPFVEQKENFCGPAALASVLAFHGIEASQDELAQSVYSEKAGGTAGIMLVAEARKRGLWVDKDHRGEVSLLREALAEDLPVIVMVKAGGAFGTTVHFMTVVGVGDTLRLIYAHDGYDAAAAYPLRLFQKWWAAAGCWYMLAARPGRPPSSEYVELGLKAEKDGDGEKAREHYARAAELARTPLNRAVAFINLSRLAVADNDPARAETLARAAKGEMETLRKNHRILFNAQKRKYADTLNNLAWITGVMLGEKAEAERLVARALELFPGDENYMDTAAHLEK